MRRTLGALTIALLLVSASACSKDGDSPDSDTTITDESRDPAIVAAESLERQGWKLPQYGSTGALNTTVEMEKRDGEGAGGRSIVQTRETMREPEENSARNISSFEVDPTVSRVTDVGTREFGAKTGYGVQYRNETTLRLTQRWHVHDGENLLTITVDYQAEEIPDEALAALDEVAF